MTMRQFLGFVTIVLVLGGCTTTHKHNHAHNPSVAPAREAALLTMAPDAVTTVGSPSVLPATGAEAEAAPMTEEPAAGTAGALVLAAFDDDANKTALGGDIGTWGVNPNDATQRYAMRFDARNRYGNQGGALRLEYDVDSSNPAYGGLWVKLNDLDLSQYHQVVFWVKGDRKQGYTRQFKVELKNEKE